MKKDRNCMGYPVYPNMGSIPMPIPMYPTMDYGNDCNELNQIMTKLNNLEQRVTAIENMLNKNYNNNYNTNNYQMM